MYDTALIFCLREYCLYGFMDAGRSIRVQEMLCAAVLKVVYHGQPALGVFVITCLDSPDLFLSNVRTVLKDIKAAFSFATSSILSLTIWVKRIYKAPLLVDELWQFRILIAPFVHEEYNCYII